MNFLSKNPPAEVTSRSRRVARAFTLTELLITVSLMMMVMGAILMSHLFGLRFFEITKAKLVASDDARQTLTRLVAEVRGAKTILVGNGSLTSFTPAADGSLQQGSAIQIFSSTNTNSFIRYFWTASEGKLKRTTNGVSGTELLASSVTNSLIFTSEDHLGNVLTDSQNNRVIGVTLRFRQLMYPIVNIGPGNYYDFYQLRTRITRRTLE